MQSGQSLLFVYGTLKRGHRAHHLMQRARFLGPARSAPGHILVDCRGYPGLVALPDSDSAVGGEFYSVVPEHLAVLDAYEDLASGEYIRASLLATGEDGLPKVAHAYFYNWPWDRLPRIGDTWLPIHETV